MKATPFMRPPHIRRASAGTCGGRIVAILMALSLLSDPAIVSAREPAGAKLALHLQAFFAEQALAVEAGQFPRPGNKAGIHNDILTSELLPIGLAGDTPRVEPKPLDQLLTRLASSKDQFQLTFVIYEDERLRDRTQKQLALKLPKADILPVRFSPQNDISLRHSIEQAYRKAKQTPDILFVQDVIEAPDPRSDKSPAQHIELLLNSRATLADQVDCPIVVWIPKTLYELSRQEAPAAWEKNRQVISIDLQKEASVSQMEEPSLPKPPSDEPQIAPAIDDEFSRSDVDLLEFIFPYNLDETLQAFMKEHTLLSPERARESLRKLAMAELIYIQDTLRRAGVFGQTIPQLLAALPRCHTGMLVLADAARMERGLHWLDLRGHVLRQQGETWRADGLASQWPTALRVKVWKLTHRKRWIELIGVETYTAVAERVEMILNAAGSDPADLEPLVARRLAEWKANPHAGMDDKFDEGLEFWAELLGVEPILLRTGRSRSLETIRTMPLLPGMSRGARVLAFRRLEGKSHKTLKAETGIDYAGLRALELDTKDSYEFDHPARWKALAESLHQDPFLIFAALDEAAFLAATMPEGQRTIFIQWAAGITEQEFAGRVGVSRNIISRWRTKTIPTLSPRDLLWAARAQITVEQATLLRKNQPPPEGAHILQQIRDAPAQILSTPTPKPWWAHFFSWTLVFMVGGLFVAQAQGPSSSPARAPAVDAAIELRMGHPIAAASAEPTKEPTRRMDRRGRRQQRRLKRDA